MAISLFAAFGVNEKTTTSNSTLNWGIGGTIGKFVVAAVSMRVDSGDPNSGISMTDSKGNTWSLRHTGGSGNIHIAVFTAPVTVSFSASDTFSLSTGVSTTARAWYVGEFTATAFNYVGGATTMAASTISRSIASSGNLAIGYDFFNDTDVITGDSDTTNGSWSSILQSGTTGGSASTNAKIGSQHKIVTASGTQSFDPSSSATDNVTLLEFSESAEAPRFIGGDFAPFF